MYTHFTSSFITYIPRLVIFLLPSLFFFFLFLLLLLIEMLGQTQNRKRPANDCESLSPSTTHASTLSDTAQDPKPPHHPSSSSIQFASSSFHQLGPIHTSSEPQPPSRNNSNSNVPCHSATEDTHHHTSKSPRFSISPSTSPGPSIDVNTDPPSTPNATGDAFQVIVLVSYTIITVLCCSVYILFT